MNIIEFLKNGSGIHIKKKNRGKFTEYCGGKVTSECIAKGKNSSNPTIRKRATFAANARKWKHKEGGSIKAGEKAKQNLTKRKDPDWDNLDRGYRYLTQDMKLPHDQAIALMGNIVEESQGNYKAVQKNGGGKGLIQWDGQPAPSTRYGQWGKVWASVAKPANIYDSKTDTMKNYWAPYNGLKGEQVRQKFIKAPLSQKTIIYAKSYLRPGKPRILDRKLSAMQLDSIYNPKIKNIIVRNKKGGKAFVKGVSILDSNPDAYKYVKKKYKMRSAQEGTKLNFWQKAGNFMNGDVGKWIINGVNGFMKTSSQNKQLDANAAQQKADNMFKYQQITNSINNQVQNEIQQMHDQWRQNYLQGLTKDNPSNIVTNHIGYQMYNDAISSAKQALDYQNKAIDKYTTSQKASNTGNTLGGFINQGLGILTNYMGSKSSPTPTTAPTVTSTTGIYDKFNVFKNGNY